jgi:hypothetical protein
MSESESYVEKMKGSVRANPGMALGVIVVLALVVIGLAVYSFVYKGAEGFEGINPNPIGIAKYNNLTIGGANPMWYLGSGDAGWGGPVHRETTAYQAADYLPNWRWGSGHGANAKECMQGGMYRGNNGQPGTMAPGQCTWPYTGPYSPICSPWDPAANVEVQALASVGGFAPESRAEGRLQGAAEAALDTNAALSDETLERVMHQGGP